ncbi:MAG TPA: diguanylate cyclase [Burkholderiaceae bacterium]|nr:diguanylate cyclase [Burkholderiaceae bacterium]
MTLIGTSERTAAIASAARPSVDLRSAFAMEVRVLPATLILFGAAAYAAGSVAQYAWLWLIAGVVNAAMRYLVASEFERNRNPVGTSSRAARLFIASYAADIVLWLALFLHARTLAPVLMAGAGAALAGAVFLGTLVLRVWPRAWIGMMLGWAAIAAVAILRAEAQPHGFVYVFPLWLLAMGWIGLMRAPPPRTVGGALPATMASATVMPATHESTLMPITQVAATAKALSIDDVPVPVFVLRGRRIIDLNPAAARLVGRSQEHLRGRACEDILDFDPPDITDAPPSSGAVTRDSGAGRLRVRDSAGLGSGWTVRVRHLDAGTPAAVAVVAVGGPLAPVAARGAADTFATDAARFAEWVGGAQAIAWFRDDAANLHLPVAYRRAATVPGSGAVDPGAFPLSSLVVAEERSRIDALFRERVRTGRTFDEVMTLVDAGGVRKLMRVACALRTIDAQHAPAAVGMIAPAAARSSAAADPAEMLGRLPVLIWLVDGAGRVIGVHGREAPRWGLRMEGQARMLWFEAIAFRDASRATFERAIQAALAGRPTFDVLNSRSSPTGGRVALRSHFVPYGRAPAAGAGGAWPAVMVMDAVASPEELREIERLRRSKAQYKALVEASPNLIWACDAQFKFTFVSKRAAREIYGYGVSDLIGRSLDDLLDPGVDQWAARKALQGLREGHALRDHEMVHVTREKRRTVASVSAVALRGAGGQFAGAIGMNVDLTALKQRERRLTEALRIERSVLDSAGQAIAVVKGANVARCNDAFVTMLHMQASDVARLKIEDVFADPSEWAEIAADADAGRAEDRPAVREILMRHGGPGGNPADSTWCQLTARSVGVGEYVLALADIDRILRREAHLRHDALHDDLTGLANRRLFAERARSALDDQASRPATCAVAVIDLDGFKDVNDRFGHRVGDAVLREMSSRLAGVMRPQDTVARRGGDEFAVLLPEAGLRADVERIVERLLREIRQPITLAAGQSVSLSASIGIALAPEHGTDQDRLLQLADHAMYEAKLRGKGRYHFAGTPTPPQPPQQYTANVTPITGRTTRAS